MPALYPTTPEGTSSGAELVTTDGRVLALVGARLVGEARGGIARLVLEQTFANHHAEVLKVMYRMPLPADGAVSGYEFVIGDRTIKGVVDKKHRARERFEQAIASGHTAALLEQERADIFTQQLGNIPPNERVVARITIDQRLVWLPEGEWELRFPTVIGPRYIGTADTVFDARATHVKVTEQPLAVTFQIALTIGDAITGGAKPTSPSHTLTRATDGTISLHSGARLDRDIIVRWAVAAAAPGLALAVARAAAGDAYGLVTIVPPARAIKAVPVARDLLVLLDTSGSMGGGPLEKAKQVVALMIDSLGEADRLELIEFSSAPKRWREEPVLATAKIKQEAIKWVRSRHADGGTEMRAAVIEALSTLRIGAQRQVLIVTDGYVGGEQQIIEAMHRRLPASCRVHVLGVGSAVNRSLATSLARAGRGAEVIVGIDEDAERGAKRLLDRTKLPMLTNVELAGSALLRHAPEKLPDVFEGAPLVAALAIHPDGGELVVRGQLAEGTWEQRITVPAQRVGEGNQAIAALYGRERVADVEAHAMFESVNGEIEELGLQFQIATRLTSWVAIDESRKVATTKPAREELVPQEVPYGTSAAAFGLRSVASAMSTTLAGSYALSEESSESSFDAFEELASAPPPPPSMPAPRSMPALGRASAPSSSSVARWKDATSEREELGDATSERDDEGDDEFDFEEPTGQVAPPRAPSSPPAQQQALPPQRAESADAKAGKDAPTGPMKTSQPFALHSVRRDEPVPETPPKVAPVTTPEPQPAKPKAALSFRLQVLLSLVAALIVFALLWWLLLG